MDATLVVAVEDQLGERVGVGLGAEALERAVVTGCEHPPRRLALRAVLAHEERGPVGDPDAHDRAARLGLLGRVLDVEPTRLGEVHEEPARGPASPTSNTRYFPRRPTAVIGCPRSDSGGTTVFSDENEYASNPANARPRRTASSRSARACICGSSGTIPYCAHRRGTRVEVYSDVDHSRCAVAALTRRRTWRLLRRGRTPRSPRGAPRSPRGTDPGRGRAAPSRCRGA